MKKIILFVVFASTFTSYLTAQNSSILASAGNKTITVDEFKMRFELSPRILYSLNQEIEKYEFLLTLLAEKVLALEGEKNNYHSQDEIKNRLYSIRKKYTLDKLYEEEIINKIKFTEEEIQNAVGRASVTNHCKFLYSNDKDEIDSLYTELNNGIPFDSLLAGRSEEQHQAEPVKVEFGQADLVLEDLIYSMPQGSFSKTFKKGDGWVIYYVQSKEIQYPDLSNDKFLKNVKDVVRQRKLSEKYTEYMRNNISGSKIDVDINLFNSLAEVIYDNDFQNVERDTSGRYLLDYDLIFGAAENLSREQKESMFVKFEKDPVNLDNFVIELSVDGLKIDSLKLNNIKYALDVYLKKYIRNEILYRKALEKEYHLYPEVEKIVNIWRDNYLASMVRKKIINEKRKSFDGKMDPEKLYEDMIIETAKIATNHEIKLNNEILSNISVSTLNMAAYKILGFGDNAIAVPYASKFDEWYEIMKELKKLELK